MAPCNSEFAGGKGPISADRRIHKSVSFPEAGVVANVRGRRDGFLQNHLLFYEQLSRPFSIENPYSSVRDRETISKDGDRISEWSVCFSEIEEFAHSFDL
jgi:hypothetical protein